MENSKRIKLSIIILSWNTKELLKQCLESVIRDTQYGIRNIEIIVVDNGSEDGSREYLKRFKGLKVQKFKVIFNDQNLGFAKANNQGIKIAQGEYIMLLNSDTIVKKGAIEKLVSSINRSDKIAAVSPLLVFPNGKPQIDYYMRFPNLWQVFLYHNSVLRPIVLKTPFLRNLICFSPQDKFFQVDQLPGAAIIIKKEVWKKVGFLDENFKFLFEDVDWCWRAKKMGYELMVEPKSKIIHFGGATWKKRLKENSFEFYYQFFSSLLLFVKKNYGRWQFDVFRFALAFRSLLVLRSKLAFHLLQFSGKQRNLWLQD